MSDKIYHLYLKLWEKFDRQIEEEGIHNLTPIRIDVFNNTFNIYTFLSADIRERIPYYELL